MLPCAPEAAIRLIQHGDHAAPDWLGPQDHGWLEVLVEEHERFLGKRRRELAARLREPLPCFAPGHKRLLATAVLGKSLNARSSSHLLPRSVREQLALAATRTGSRAEALTATAATLGATIAELEAAVFADLPGEKVIEVRGAFPKPADLALSSNLLLAQSLLQRALEVKLAVEGHSRPLLRQAIFKGLICALEVGNDPARIRSASTTLEQRITISGPLSLLKRTTIYGRAMAELAAILPWTGKYLCEVRCLVHGTETLVHLRSGDPVMPGAAPRRHDSAVEARFARDFARIAPCWDLIREPAPCKVQDGWIFPDFLLRHRTLASRQAWLEIVGFWTADYLQKKLTRLREAGLVNLILCVDSARACSLDALQSHASTITYRKWIDPTLVLEKLEQLP